MTSRFPITHARCLRSFGVVRVSLNDRKYPCDHEDVSLSGGPSCYPVNLAAPRQRRVKGTRLRIGTRSAVRSEGDAMSAYKENGVSAVSLPTAG